jgi:ParB-like chromosome segregation protein Spo0J
MRTCSSNKGLSHVMPRDPVRFTQSVTALSGQRPTHSRKQIKLIADSIKRFGFTNPILVTDDFEVVAGHGRLQAAKSLGMNLVPVVALSSLSEADKKALIIADNRIGSRSRDHRFGQG